MKKIVFLILFLFLSLITNAQVPIEFNIQAKGSDSNGVLGAELQIHRFSITESWRPVIRNTNSFITTFTIYFKEDMFFQSYPYVSAGYSTKGYPYFDRYPYIGDPKFCPAIVLIGGFKTVIYEISDRFNTRAGLGVTLSEKGECFSFEVGISYALIKNKPYERSQTYYLSW